MKQLWRAETFLFLMTWLFLMVLGRGASLKDPGIFWNTATGATILDTCQFPTVDTYSCTRPGQPWTPQGTFGAIAMALLYRVGGFDAFVLATATIFAALYAWIAHRFIRAGMHWVFTLLPILLFFETSIPHYHARPFLVTTLMMAWTYTRLADFEAGRLSLARLFWLWPAFALWMNFHTGALGGIGTLTLAVLGWIAAYAFGGNTPIASFRHVALLLLLTVGSWLTVFINPYGAELPRSVLTLLRSPVLAAYMLEHRSLLTIAPGNPPLYLLYPEWFIWVAYVALLWLLALANTEWRNWRVTWLLPLAWLVLGVKSVRNAPLFSLLALLSIAEIVPYTRLGRWLSDHDSFIFRKPAPGARPGATGWLSFVLPILLVGGVLSLQASGTRAGAFGAGWAQINPEYWPTDLLPQLEDFERRNPGAGVLNDMLYGGFLIHYTPGLRVFIDDRAELYGDDMMREYGEEYTEAPGHDPQRIDRWIADYDLRLALVDKGLPLDGHLAASPRWRRLGETQKAVLYERVEGP